jgi:hypothetical protein
MSRATQLRDAMITELASRLGDSVGSVKPFSLLVYDRSEFVEKPLVLVRVAGRELLATQGPDEQMVLIDVLIAAAIPDRTGTTETEWREELVAHYDEFDGTFESLLDLWVPDGPLKTEGIADFRFVSIEEVIGFEMDELYRDGVYLSWIQLKYQDTFDEDDRT